MSASLIGLSPTLVQLVTDVPGFKLGTIGGYDDPVDGYKEFMYGTATAAITGLGYLCVEGTLNGNFSMITTANTAAGTIGGHGSRIGAAQAALSTGQSGWFQVVGKGSLRTAASDAAGTRQNTTATAGVPDDDGTAAARAINGIVLKTATGGAEATNADARFFYPTTGVTL